VGGGGIPQSLRGYASGLEIFNSKFMQHGSTGTVCRARDQQSNLHSDWMMHKNGRFYTLSYNRGPSRDKTLTTIFWQLWHRKFRKWTPFWSRGPETFAELPVRHNFKLNISNLYIWLCILNKNRKASYIDHMQIYSIHASCVHALCRYNAMCHNVNSIMLLSGRNIKDTYCFRKSL
jgi:hypothetical protein